MMKTLQNQKPLIHFAHANGIPSQTYRYLFELLSDEFDIVYIPQLGTNPNYPVDEGWQQLTQQVIDNVKSELAKRGQQQLIGLGHSLGALCTLQACYREPQLFSQAVILDPPLMHGRYAMLVHWAKRNSPKLLDKLTPAGLSSRRRDVWSSREDAQASLRPKAFYQNFDERCFADFMQYGFESLPTGEVTLAIPKAVEVAVFRTNPSLYWLKPTYPPAMPVTQLVGADSIFYQRGFPQAVKEQMGVDFEVHVGGHMFPLEYPESTVKQIKAIIHAHMSSTAVSNLNL